MAEIKTHLRQLVNEGNTPEKFYDVCGVEKVVEKLQHIRMGSPEDFQKAAEDVCRILSIEESPDEHKEDFSKLSAQLVGPNENLTDEEKFNWYLLMDAINFHFFYPDGGRYNVTYKGNKYSGSMAASAAINAWIDENPGVLNPDVLSVVDEKEVEKAFKSDNGLDIPMLEERVDSIRSTFTKLKENGGSFFSIIKKCNWDAAEILLFILENFPSFDDVTKYKTPEGQEVEVAFCKRAQLLIADIFRNLGHLAEQKKLNMDFLTAFADYRVPQILRYYKLVNYDDYLDKKVREGFLEDPQLEVEIRIATIAACEYVSRCNNRPAADVDNAIWKKRRLVGSALDEEFPYHKLGFGELSSNLREALMSANFDFTSPTTMEAPISIPQYIEKCFAVIIFAKVDPLLASTSGFIEEKFGLATDSIEKIEPFSVGNPNVCVIFVCLKDPNWAAHVVQKYGNRYPGIRLRLASELLLNAASKRSDQLMGTISSEGAFHMLYRPPPPRIPVVSFNHRLPMRPNIAPGTHQHFSLSRVPNIPVIRPRMPSVIRRPPIPPLSTRGPPPVLIPRQLPRQSQTPQPSMDLTSAQEAVLVRSEKLDDDTPQVRGYDFNEGINYEKLLDSYLTTGFQATNLALAIEEVNKMIEARTEEPPIEEDVDPMFPYPEGKKRPACTIFLGYTSNLVSSGLRETIRYVVERDAVDCIVTSAGGIEEDFIKCLCPTFLGDFSLAGKALRAKGLNRIGNLLVPNDNYCAFEEWLMPILDQCLKEQEAGFQWTPSKLISRLGKEINNKDSICYWAYKNNIPVFCPALTDGSLGDMLYFHSVMNSPGLKLDIVEDLRHINTMAVKSFKSGVIILGGGMVKHHINNANLMRNGSDYTVFVNTGQEFDGSDSGARPDEAVSWGKVRSESKAVKVFADATLVFPLIVAKTFAKTQENGELKK
ncbi:hypothetical protein FO519_005214 [Halicephalobus sp. NKZ332]|nr:hypothetical protein FO519_005214 [Halicephalobus sp. NKZ332]